MQQLQAAVLPLPPKALDAYAIMREHVAQLVLLLLPGLTDHSKGSLRVPETLCLRGLHVSAQAKYCL